MRIRIDKWLVILAVIALSTLSWWMPLETRPVSPLVIVPEKRHIQDFYLADFDLTTMNAEGKPRYQLQGRDMRHYADDDTSQIAQPQLTLYRQGEAPWFVRAEQAQVAAAGASVLLQEQVKVRRLTEIPRDKLEISAPVLTVFPAEEYAETDRPVTIVTDFGVTRAIGMKADLKHQRLQLLAEVRGEYARP